jgi:hypothetical protein
VIEYTVFRNSLLTIGKPRNTLSDSVSFSFNPHFDTRRWHNLASEALEATSVILKMHSVRVYGSNSSYGQEANQNPIGGSIALNDFPSDGERSEVLLGEAPRLMFDAHRRKTALANTILNMTFGRSITITEEYTLEDAIRDQLRNEIAVPPVKEYPWYVTISITRDIEVTAESIVGSELHLANVPEETNFRQFREYAKPFVDHIAAIASTVLGLEFFEYILFDEVLFTGDTGVVTRIPLMQDFKMSARGSVRRSIDSLDLSALTTLLSSKRLQLYAKNRWIERAVYWFTSGLNEPDHWKSFQYLFLSLEILTHKLHKQLLNVVSDSFAFKKPNGELLDGIPMSDLLGKRERHSLVSKFSIVALGLSPETAEADVSSFKRIKTERDNLAHGDLRNERELSLHVLRDLCSRYFEALFRQASPLT